MLRVLKELRELRVHKEVKGLKVHKVPQVIQGRLVLKEDKELKEQLDLKVLQVR